ncbi:MAG TPA: ABC transporter ATP-binding protein [Thermodesulfobacteriota bacterium]|nr:ABC transporter ATP-binding protein [Thermodesulfobacteriota bacterium]
MAEIRFQGVEKRFKDVLVVKNLDLTIEDREFFTFVGPSGCGKSTIMNMIAGLEEVSSGIIHFDGVPINNLSPGERDVAMVFQSYALYPHMTVYENISFPLRVKKLPKEKIDEEINRVAAILDLKPLLRRKPRELSGGQRQRVALGRALIRKPRVFLMDEPLSNLDARLRIETRAELKRLHQELQITTVYVTHDQEEAMVLSDRIAVLYQGKIQQCGHPMEVYAKPANLFVAWFIGSPPMNMIDGSLLKDITIFKPVLEQFENRQIIVGIRPSDVAVSAKGDETTLEGKVLLLEPTGSDTWVDFLWKEKTMKGILLAEEKMNPGTRVFFKIPLEKLHFFDKSSGERLV